MQPGDIAIASELTLPKQPEFDGTRTRRITTLRQGDTTSRREQVTASPAAQPAAPAGTVYATLAYEDRRGAQKVQMTKNQLVIGRGGVGYWVDVKLDTSADVSREHVRLRRDEGTGAFFLKDLSSIGTTIDGTAVPSSVEVVEGRKRDKGIEVPLPPRARIGLANVIVLDFQAGGAA
jgi:pSer/pThr/pTyr-binding forkhead associated (FHA) protein